MISLAIPQTRRGTFALDATLLARAFVHAIFMVWLLSTLPGWSDIFWVGSVFGLVDGALGLLTAFLVTRTPVSAPPKLVAMVLADACMRIAAGSAIRLFPGVVDIPIVLVLFFGALGTWAALAGVTAIGALLSSHARHHGSRNVGASRRIHALFDPLGGAGMVALGLAAFAFVAGPPATASELRTMAAISCGAMSLIFAVAAVSATHALLHPQTGFRE